MIHFCHYGSHVSIMFGVKAGEVIFQIAVTSMLSQQAVKHACVIVSVINKGFGYCSFFSHYFIQVSVQRTWRPFQKNNNNSFWVKDRPLYQVSFGICKYIVKFFLFSKMN